MLELKSNFEGLEGALSVLVAENDVHNLSTAVGKCVTALRYTGCVVVVVLVLIG